MQDDRVIGVVQVWASFRCSSGPNPCTAPPPLPPHLVNSTGGPGFLSSHVKALRVFASFCGIAICNAKMYEQVRNPPPPPHPRTTHIHTIHYIFAILPA